ncbi:unnamed protein product, partial [Timema podura]|nr:unnamed protein product [Timema podura]
VQRDLKTRTRAQVAELPKAWSATGNQAKSLPLNNIELKMMITIIATETSTGVEGIQEIGFGDDSLLCMEVSSEVESTEVDHQVCLTDMTN